MMWGSGLKKPRGFNLPKPRQRAWFCFCGLCIRYVYAPLIKSNHGLMRDTHPSNRAVLM